MNDSRRRLLWHGMFLFLLGLLVGFVEQQFANARMGLAAHLEGVMNGTFLIALGAVWSDVTGHPRLKAVALWGALYATYGNWAVTTFAAIFGSGAMSPILAPGRTAAAWQETFVTIGFMTIGPAYVLSTVIVLWGLRGGAYAATRGASTTLASTGV